MNVKKRASKGVSKKEKKAVNKKCNDEKKTPKKRTSSKAKSKKSDKDIIQINVWNIKLTKDSRKRLNKVKNPMWGTVAHAIEWGNWYIPVKNYLYTHIKKSLEDGMRDFFTIDSDIPVEIESFQTHILEYDNHY